MVKVKYSGLGSGLFLIIGGENVRILKDDIHEIPNEVYEGNKSKLTLVPEETQSVKKKQEDQTGGDQ